MAKPELVVAPLTPFTSDLKFNEAHIRCQAMVIKYFHFYLVAQVFRKNNFRY